MVDYLKPFLSRPSYYAHNGKQLVTTFGGEQFDDSKISQFKSNVGGNVLFIPGLYNGATSADIFSKNPSYDGVFGWNSWPSSSAGNVETTPETTDDAVWAQAVSKSPGKLRIAGLSPINFKHYAGQNWYRRGEQNLEVRMAALLKDQPDMIEIQTWNDAPESHYIGNLWDEPNTGNTEAQGWYKGFDHTGYQQVIKAFAKAWHNCESATNMVPTNGKRVQGAFWHHVLTVGGDCSADPKGKPNPLPAEDSVSGVVLAAKGSAGLVAVVNNGDKELGKLTLTEGYNSFKFNNLGAGKVQLEVCESIPESEIMKALLMKRGHRGWQHHGWWWLQQPDCADELECLQLQLPGRRVPRVGASHVEHCVLDLPDSDGVFSCRLTSGVDTFCIYINFTHLFQDIPVHSRSASTTCSE